MNKPNYAGNKINKLFNTNTQTFLGYVKFRIKFNLDESTKAWEREWKFVENICIYIRIIYASLYQIHILSIHFVFFEHL